MKANSVTLGILAHVDAGKTTLAEGLFYLSKKIRKRGRVDHKDAFFDYESLERERGITIFSKMATLPLGDCTAILLDTPGHVDFSAEMERALSVMDYAVLIISGTDGVQSHTRTLFELLKRYRVPAFLFVNKMDRPETDRERLMQELKAELSEACIDFGVYQNLSSHADMETPDGKESAGAESENYEKAGFNWPKSESFYEELAMCDEEWMEAYLSGEELTEAKLRAMIASGKVYPCFFGSALHMNGVAEFYQALGSLVQVPEYPKDFTAQVYKILRDEKGSRLAAMKITGGVLHARDEVTDTSGKAHKIHQIRIYEGAKYENVSEAEAGQIVAVTGLDGVEAGECIFIPGTGSVAERNGNGVDDRPKEAGLRSQPVSPVLKPVLRYTIVPESDAADPKTLFGKIKDLSEELPELSVSWEEQTQTIGARLMGEVQIEIVKELIRERFGAEVRFEQGSIVYQETIAAPVIGIGHFEPIRHYAEVHVLIEPNERGGGIRYENRCPDELLERGWQQTALRHLKNKEHLGVLTGSALTDVTISLIAGRSHKKHSEGADFMEAAHRAVRQGLMQAESVLLEPYYAFRLAVPTEHVGRAMTDIRGMGGTLDDPVMGENQAVLCGRAPVSKMQDYARTVQSYTGGRGSLSTRLDGYDLCQNADEVVAAAGYDPDADLLNPSSSLFFKQGAAVYVPWHEVAEAARVDSGLTITEDGTAEKSNTDASDAEQINQRIKHGGGSHAVSAFSAEDKELSEIFARTYGSKNAKAASRKDKNHGDDLRKIRNVQGTSSGRKIQEAAESYLLVDGYNIIHAWKDLKDLAHKNLDSARDVLMDILSDYQGSRGGRLILVFDAYRVKGGTERTYRYHNIDIVFTKEAETADAYIERVTKQIAKKYDVTVATSDGLEQIIIWGHGAKRMSAMELKAEVEDEHRKVQEFINRTQRGSSRLFEHLDEEDAEAIEKLRLGEESDNQTP